MKNPFKSLLWPIFEKVNRLLLGTVLLMLVARELGPSDFGTFSSVFAGLMIASAVAGLGIKDIAVDEIASGRVESSLIVSSSSFLLFLAGAIVSIVFCAMIFVRDGHESSAFVVCSILSIVLVLKGFEAVSYGLEARGNIRDLAIANQISIVFGACAKAAVLAIGPSVTLLAVATTFEFLVMYFTYYFFGNRCGIPLSIKSVSRPIGKRLISRGWPMLISGLAYLGYFYVDQLIILFFYGPADVGQYAAPVRIAQQLFILPVLLVSAYFPLLTYINTRSNEEFTALFETLLAVMIVFSVIVISAISIGGNRVVGALLGSEFERSRDVFSIYMIGLLFITINVLCGRWYVMQGLQGLASRRQVMALVVNVILNLLLIPSFGIIGAAWASVLTLCFMAIFLDYFDKRTRFLVDAKRNAVVLAFKPLLLARRLNELRVAR